MGSSADEEEVLRAVKLLEALIKAHGLTRKALDQRLGRNPGYTSQVLNGRTELKLRHVLEILRALELEPGLFFGALFPASENAPLKPAAPPLPPLLDSDELVRRIRFAIEEALGKRRGQE